MDKRYQHITLKKEFVIDRLYSFHYNELSKDYVFPGERHNFWEFLYVDKGEVEIMIEGKSYLLKQGEMVFYPPNEDHSLQCNRRTPPNIFIISFDCSSDNLRSFSNRTLKLGNEERHLLSQIIEEGQQAFASPPQRKKRKNQLHRSLGKRDNAPFGADQLVKIYMEALFIRLYRNSLNHAPEPKLSTITKEKEESDLAARIEGYINDHLMQPMTLQQICRDFSLSKTHLTEVFRKHTNCSIIEYWRRLKMEKARELIREATYNVTEISELLGFSSIHYFSRRFKQSTGMTPSEYLRRLKVKM